MPGFVNAHYHSHDVLMKGLFEEQPFDIWTTYTGAASYGTRSHREVRLRTLIGAAEMLRNGITTVQDFLTVYPADPAYVDTVLSAYADAGIRVVFAIAARDRDAARHRAADGQGPAGQGPARIHPSAHPRYQPHAPKRSWTSSAARSSGLAQSPGH